MNKYPVWWDSAITIYNKYIDPITQVITWYRHVVGSDTPSEGCFWNNDNSMIIAQDTVLSSNTTICRVPASETFLDRHNWISLTSDKRADYFTLGRGDIVIKGTVEDVIDEYQKGHRSTDLLNKYKDVLNCIQVETYKINVGPGRVNEHYLIRGN